MRICSLLPSATEIAFAIGLGDELVAVTHECDYPPEARRLPKVTAKLLPAGLSVAEIDRAVTQSQRDEHTIYALDAGRLRDLEPDLVLTQNICEVCAVPRAAVEEAVCSMPVSAQIISLDPRSLADVLADIRRVGEATGRQARAGEVVAALEARVRAVQETVSKARYRPRVFCAEWLDPVYCCGHWVPEMVGLAGGEEGLGRLHQPSVRIQWEEVLRWAPDVLVLMPCGFGAAAAIEQAHLILDRPDAAQVPAVRDGRVFAVDASSYFARPGPRLVDGLEMLARLFHPGLFPGQAPAGAAFRLDESRLWEPA